MIRTTFSQHGDTVFDKLIKLLDDRPSSLFSFSHSLSLTLWLALSLAHAFAQPLTQALFSRPRLSVSLSLIPSLLDRRPHMSHSGPACVKGRVDGSFRRHGNYLLARRLSCLGVDSDMCTRNSTDLITSLMEPFEGHEWRSVEAERGYCPGTRARITFAGSLRRVRTVSSSVGYENVLVLRGEILPCFSDTKPFLRQSS